MEKTGHFYYLFIHFRSGQEKLEMGISDNKFSSKNMKNISKCLQNNVVSKATSKYIVFCFRLYTSLFISVQTAKKIDTGVYTMVIFYYIVGYV